MIKTAVVGFGLSANVFHLPFISLIPEYELVALSTSRQDEARRAWPGASVYASAETMLRECDADLVFVTSPHDSHYSLTKLALEQGKHVSVEKPFVPDAGEARELVALAQTQGKTLTVFQNRRWDGDFLTLKQLMATGAVGTVKYFESHFDRFRPVVRERWREQPGIGSGTWYDLGAHLVDQVLVLFGMPAGVTGRCIPVRAGSQVPDYFHVQFHYPDKEVVLHGSRHQAGPNIRFQLQGTGGSYIKYGLDPQEPRLTDGVVPEGSAWAAEAPSDYGTLYTETDATTVPTITGGYQAYFHGLADAILNGAANPVPAAEAVNSIYLIQLAQQSSDEGRTLVVQQPNDPLFQPNRRD